MLKILGLDTLTILQQPGVLLHLLLESCIGQWRREDRVEVTKKNCVQLSGSATEHFMIRASQDKSRKNNSLVTIEELVVLQFALQNGTALIHLLHYLGTRQVQETVELKDVHHLSSLTEALHLAQEVRIGHGDPRLGDCLEYIVALEGDVELGTSKDVMDEGQEGSHVLLLILV